MAGQVDEGRFAEIVKLAGREGSGVEHLATSS